METAKGHGLNVFKYLTYLFEYLPNVDFLMKPELLEDFLPWVKNIQESFKGI
ncbi:transposase domain-containing protein [Turicibacter bilis]|uniref:transposase domain-containing protein n=1 Tax=Turicibacter bilis TaxID=2735723 RepID=UPI001BAFDC90|nr:transposase domain-containing protein [Turicibacter bilis]UUF12010.1 transposase domain-containing protein [Turicibacter bilis]